LTFKGSGQGSSTSQVALSTDGKTLTITLGTFASSSKGTQVVSGGGTATYSGAVAGQTGAPTDTAGIAVGTTPSAPGTSSHF
jgi:hypothetical protein